MQALKSNPNPERKIGVRRHGPVGVLFWQRLTHFLMWICRIAKARWRFPLVGCLLAIVGGL